MEDVDLMLRTLDLKLVMQSKPINLFNQHRKKCVTRKQMKQHVSVLKCSKLSLMQEQGSLNISIWRKLAVSISIHSMSVSEAGSVNITTICTVCTRIITKLINKNRQELYYIKQHDRSFVSGALNKTKITSQLQMGLL